MWKRVDLGGRGRKHGKNKVKVEEKRPRETHMPLQTVALTPAAAAMAQQVNAVCRS